MLICSSTQKGDSVRMAKKEKIALTPEERLAKMDRKREKRKIFGETFLKACALFLAVVFVYAATYVAFGEGRTVYQSIQTNTGTVSGGVVSGGGSTVVGGGSGAAATDEAQTAADAINAATKAAVDGGAGYTWSRTSEFTQNVDVGGATSTLNGIIQAVDPNASIDSVVGGFIGIGNNTVDIAKGADAQEEIGYHGAYYKLKATSLQAADLQNLQVNGDTYTFTLPDANTPKRDGGTALNRLTEDIVVQDEVSAEIQGQVGSALEVTSLVGTYSNINVTVVITEGQLTELRYSYDATVSELGLRAAIIPITGTGAMHTEASYTNFVY